MVDWVLLLPLTAAFGMALALLGLLRLGRRKTALSRLDYVLTDLRVAEATAATEATRSASKRRLVRSLLSGAGRLTSRAYPTRGYMDLERALTLAGRPFGWSAREFIGLRTLMLGLGAAIGLGLTVGYAGLDATLLAVFAFGGLGFFAPGVWLRGRIDRRQKEIDRDLPDVLDLMCLCLDAGLGLEGAMVAAARQWQGPLIEEFNQTLSEIRLGWPRLEALRRMILRTDVLQLSAFVAAIVQAEQLGTSVRTTLMVQAIEARSAYRRRVQEAGYKAPIKMMIPMTIFILPAMFIVVIGPVVPEIARSFGGP